MKVFTLILLAFLSSLVLGCSSAPQKTLLEDRAGYGAGAPPNMNLSGAGSVQYVPTRVPEKVIVPWLHAKELPSKDYFWGTWLSVVVTPETWEMRAVEVPKGISGKAPKTEDRPRIGRHGPPKEPKGSKKAGQG